MTKATELQRIRIENQAQDWCRRLERGELSTEEAEVFGAWMAVPAHAAAFAGIEWSGACVDALDRGQDPEWEAWKDEALHRAQSGGPKVEPLADWSDLVFAPRAPASARGTRRRRWVRAAAVAACLALAVIVLPWQKRAPASVLHYQAGDATREVLLPDGTRLTLDAGTAVDYLRIGNERRLQLPSGRVYLQVSKDPGGARFVVRSGEVETVVLGTRFLVSQSAGRTEVVLEEGRVRMQKPGTTLAATLVPGEHGWWVSGADAFQTAKANPASALAWTRGRLMFEDVALADAVAEVNRYARNVHIELADSAVGRLRVSGSYVAGDAELVVAAWEATLPVRSRHDGGRIVLEAKTDRR